MEKFSRWLRAICTILLSRNSQADRKKAITYAEQALTVMEDPDTSGEVHDAVHDFISLALTARSCRIVISHGRTPLAAKYRLQHGCRVPCVRMEPYEIFESPLVNPTRSIFQFFAIERSEALVRSILCNLSIRPGRRTTIRKGTSSNSNRSKH